MNGIILDLIFIAVLAVFAILGMYKGFFSTLLSLLGFLGTLVVAFLFKDQMAFLLNSLFGITDWLAGTLGNDIAYIITVVIGIVLTYIIIKIIVFILKHTVGQLFKGEVLGKFNVAFGFVLGIIKGVVYSMVFFVIVSILTLIPSVKTYVDEKLQGTYIVSFVYEFVENQIASNFTNTIEETEPEE
jgi:uncharacterized membrane protein required for colicin V production